MKCEVGSVLTDVLFIAVWIDLRSTNENLVCTLTHMAHSGRPNCTTLWILSLPSCSKHSSNVGEYKWVAITCTKNDSLRLLGERAAGSLEGTGWHLVQLHSRYKTFSPLSRSNCPHTDQVENTANIIHSSNSDSVCLQKERAQAGGSGMCSHLS